MSCIESSKVKIEETEVHLPDILHDIRTIIQADVTAKQFDLFIDTVKFTKPDGMLSIRIIEKCRLRQV